MYLGARKVSTGVRHYCGQPSSDSGATRGSLSTGKNDSQAQNQEWASLGMAQRQK